MNMIEKAKMLYKAKRGAMTGGATGLVVFTILMIGVVAPIVQDLIDNSTLTGMAATILNYVPVFVVLIVLVVYARMADN